MSKQPNGEVDDHAGVAFRPPVLLLLTLVLGFLARWWRPLDVLPGIVSAWLGPPVTFLALALFAWAVITMRRAGASIPTHEPSDRIVSHGPYAFSRNPIYLSMVGLHLGLWVWCNSLWFVATAAISCVLLTRGVITREERYLERTLSEPYTAYRSRVRRWL